MNYRKLSAGILAAVGLVSIAGQGAAANGTRAQERPGAKQASQISPTDIDSEIGETGIVGSDLDRYAEWLSQNRSESLRTVRDKRMAPSLKVAYSRVGAGVLTGQRRR